MQGKFGQLSPGNVSSHSTALYPAFYLNWPWEKIPTGTVNSLPVKYTLYNIQQYNKTSGRSSLTPDQLRLPWAWLPLQPVLPAHGRARLLHCRSRRSLQRRGADAAPLHGSQRRCQVVSSKSLPLWMNWVGAGCCVLSRTVDLTRRADCCVLSRTVDLTGRAETGFVVVIQPKA